MLTFIGLNKVTLALIRERKNATTFLKARSLGKHKISLFLHGSTGSANVKFLNFYIVPPSSGGLQVPWCTVPQFSVTHSLVTILISRIVDRNGWYCVP